MNWGLKILFLSTIMVFQSCGKPIFINENDNLSNTPITPGLALYIAEPYLDVFGSYSIDKNEPLRTYMVIKGNWYYIKRTNYPAKHIGFYMKHAVRVHKKTGKVKTIKPKE